ncbi:hypothetical protein [Lewinella sp. IMCC34191]|uniref:hypothetical protein n=1 Tax=Lewinella sp. IMCC34191 TaxID=2259172 RepID=UPI000E27D281|nr:hypothetical protein [Lewinella sp. IMCC34191]
MKAAVLLLLLLALVSPSHAQSIDYFTDYNPLITQAEDSIVAENYTSALAAYQLAFGRVEHPFNSDLYNAALAARAADRVDLLRTYLLQLAGQGPDLDFFAANADQFEHPDLDWNSLLDSLRLVDRQYTQSVNSPMLGCFNRVLARDQELRSPYVPGDSTSRLDSLNMVAFMDCVATYGFPAQWQLDLHTPMSMLYPYEIPLLHELKMVNATGRDRFGLIPLLDSLARNGTIETATYTNLMTTQNTRMGGIGGYGNTAIAKLDDETMRLYRIVYDEATVAIYNKTRAALGLRSYEDRATLLVKRHTGQLGAATPYLIPRIMGLISYPAEVKDMLTLEYVGEWKRLP